MSSSGQLSGLCWAPTCTYGQLWAGEVAMLLLAGLSGALAGATGLTLLCSMCFSSSSRLAQLTHRGWQGLLGPRVGTGTPSLLSHSIGQWQAPDQAEIQGKEKQNLLLNGRSYNVTLERTQRQGDVKDCGHFFFFLQSTTHNKSHKQAVK